MEIDKDIAAIITGGASGLGAATAALLAERGVSVALFDIDEDKGSAHAAAIGGLFVKVDVTSEAEVKAGLDLAEAEQGTARILVNCAGVAPAVRTIRWEGAHPMDAFRKVIDVNLTGTFLMLSRFAGRLQDAQLVEEDRGVIINTSSIAAYDGQRGLAAYSASKAAIIGMTHPVALDLAPHAIRVMTIAPGLFDTAMNDDYLIRGYADPGNQVPHPARMGKAEEFARLAEHIIENSMLNGSVIRLDGALRLALQ